MLRPLTAATDSGRVCASWSASEMERHLISTGVRMAVRRTSAKLLAMALCIAPLIGASAPLGASAGTLAPTSLTPRPVVRSCHGPVTKPSEVGNFNSCGKSSVWVQNLRWTKWTLGDGQARGEVIVQVCLPDCAHGHFAHVPGTVHLFGQSRVGGLSYYVYFTATFKVPGVPGNGETQPLLAGCWASKPPCDPHWPPKSTS